LCRLPAPPERRLRQAWWLRFTAPPRWGSGSLGRPPGGGLGGNLNSYVGLLPHFVRHHGLASNFLSLKEHLSEELGRARLRSLNGRLAVNPFPFTSGSESQNPEAEKKSKKKISRKKSPEKNQIKQGLKNSFG